MLAHRCNVDRPDGTTETATVTLLTQPPRWSKQWIEGVARASIEHAKNAIAGKRNGASQSQSGPRVVCETLARGLNLLNVSFNWNPPRWNVGKYVGVLRNRHALSWAIGAKMRGATFRLAAGPNIVATPDRPEFSLFVSPTINRILVPSGWVKELYSRIKPELDSKMSVWASGVDTEYWQPSKEVAKDTDFLVYDKARYDRLRKCVHRGLCESGYSFETITYGQYQQSDYRQMLRRSRYMIFLSRCETQGLAAFEAWACDVPTFAWDRGFWQHKRVCFKGASSVPYMNPRTGGVFKLPETFCPALRSFLARSDTFKPRDYVMSGFSITQAASKYYGILTGQDLEPGQSV